MKRIVLIFNPTSGSSDLANHHDAPEKTETAIVEALRQYGSSPEVLYTTPEDAGTGLARKAAEEGADLVIAAGGDGTIHAVARGVIDTSAVLGIIPMGTMNNIARSLDIPEDIDGACKIVAEGRTSRVDVGRLNDHIFLEVAGVGLEAAIFPAAEEIKSHGILSTIRGIAKGLYTLVKFQPTKFVISFDERRRRSFRAVQVSVCNSPFYGARLQFAPDAVMDDGLLDVLIYTNFSKLDYVRHAISISQGRREVELHVTKRKVKMISIASSDPVPVHADGNQVGTTPATISIAPGILQIRVPVHTATGPNITNQKTKQTQHYKKASSNELLSDKKQGEEKNSAYVKQRQ